MRRAAVTSISTARRPTITTDPRVRVARVAVDRDSAGRVRWSTLESGHTIDPRPLWSSGGMARVALVGISMMMLAGDHVRIAVTVGDGVALEVVEPAALIAHRADGVPCSWSMEVSVGEGSSFLYNGAPLIAAEGSSIDRTIDVALAPGARTLLRETIVLGRESERSGLVRAATRLGDADGELFTERLEAGSETSRLPGLLGTARIIDSVIAVGWEPGVLPSHPRIAVLDLEEPGRIARMLDRDAAATAGPMGNAYVTWREELEVMASNALLS
ncbi:MAG: urease accessory protein [Microbacteriaceae bacterium]|jgi:urease accessory protein|nr:urease accessory protein [Microbacteriaceae bacterium]